MRIAQIILGLIFSIAALADDSTGNPLLEKWRGPYGGVPPFDKIKVSDFKPAFEKALAGQRAAYDKIAKNPDAPTFENTILALENSDRDYENLYHLFGVWSGSLKTPDFNLVEQELSPQMAKLQDEMVQNSALFKRIDAIYNAPEKSKLTNEQQRLVWVYETKFTLNGAKLNAKDKARVSEINQRLASLMTQFSQNELGDEENEFLTIDKAEELVGMPQNMIDGAADEAKRHKLEGKWVIANTRSSMEPLLTYSPNRALREKAFRIWTSRGDNKNSHNNNKIVTEILKLRAERSKILGFASYAHWRLADTMAKDPKVAMDLMLQVWKPAVERVKTEVSDMQKIVDAEKGGFKIQPWDYRFYAEKVRKAKYDLDFDIVRPYLQLDNMRKAMFWSAKQLFGFDFTLVKNIPVFNKEMSVYKVTNAKGKYVGLWYFDPYARPGKSSGAWMTNFREQYRANGEDITTIVSNNANFIPSKPGDPILISWDDAVTMFHEFGHALHGLSSNVTYKSISGTNTTRDFVEFPSQLNENYLRTPGVLKFLVNSKGERIPKALLDKIELAKNFNSGFTTVEFLASGIVDMKLHLVADKEIDPKAFETAALKELGMPSEIVMRHRIPAFGHIFSSEDYASGYYGYLWSQVLDHDAFEAFTETGDPYNKKIAKKYFDLILSVGNSQDPAENYRKFRGRDAKVDALLRASGFM